MQGLGIAEGRRITTRPACTRPHPGAPSTYAYFGPDAYIHTTHIYIYVYMYVYIYMHIRICIYVWRMDTYFGLFGAPGQDTQVPGFNLFCLPGRLPGPPKYPKKWPLHSKYGVHGPSFCVLWVGVHVEILLMFCWLLGPLCCYP